MMINKVTPSVDYNWWLKHLEAIMENKLTKPIKIESQQIRQCYYKTWGTSAINSPMSPPSLGAASIM